VPNNFTELFYNCLRENGREARKEGEILIDFTRSFVDHRRASALKSKGIINTQGTLLIIEINK
jgi:hypothetical protein